MGGVCGMAPLSADQHASQYPPGHPIDGSPLTPDSLVVSYTLFTLDNASFLSYPPAFLINENTVLEFIILFVLCHRDEKRLHWPGQVE